MEKYINKINLGDSLEILPNLPDNSIDSVVTDSPYNLGFMGRARDKTGIAYNVEIMSLSGRYHLSLLDSASHRIDVEMELLIISEV